MPHATNTTTDQWRLLLTNAHKRRLGPEQIEGALKELARIEKPNPSELVNIVLSFRLGDVCDRDPLVIRYVQLLVNLRLILPSSVLLGLLRTVDLSRELSAAGSVIVALPSFEEKAFTLMRKIVSDKILPNHIWKLHPLVFAITRWLHVVTEHELAQQLELGPLHTLSRRMLDMYDALALLAYTVVGHEHFKAIQSQPWWKTRRPLVLRELVKFDQNVLQWCHSQVSGHLQTLTTAQPFLELNDKGLPIITREMVLAEPEDLPIVRSRGGLFIWLTSCLLARPWTDDSTIRNYLLVRYLEDTQNAMLSLVVAAFDVLINSTPGQGTHVLQKRARSFICNRLPLLLSSFATVMPTGGIESCISMALVSVELAPVTPLGTTTAEAREIVRKGKLEFLQACVLHGLLNEATAASIIPDQPFTVHKHGRFNKTTLLTQCTANITRLDAFSQDLDTMSGNGAAVAGCIAELLVTLCSNRDTMTLKSACTILLKRVSAMESVFQFVAPATVLRPLCQVLNEWTHDQDQTEFQPPYEEFAVILLFLAAIVHGQGLQQSDIGAQDNDEFAGKILFGGVNNISASDLNEEQDKQLSNWISGLYATDESGETAGITDEVYSQCPPQAFYKLVPLLFEQTVLACKCKMLTLNAMKGGLEFLLEPFLLPSLLGGLQWLAETFWTDADDANVRLQVLEKLMKSTSSSQDVQTMHKAILTIVAEPLDASLQLCTRVRADKKKQATKLIEVLKPYLSRSTSHQATKEQLATWTSSEGGLNASIRSSIRDVAAWVTNGGASSGTKYTPLVLWTGNAVLGHGPVLDTMLDELKQQTDAGNGPLFLDLCSAIVCAPNQAGMPSAATESIEVSKIGLLEYLRLIIADEYKLIHTKLGKARALIRLSRAIAAQSTISPLASQLDLVNMSLPTQETADQVMQDLGLTNSDTNLEAAAAAVMGSTFDGTNFDIANANDLGLSKTADQDLNAASSMMNIDQSDDIFGSLNIDLAGASNLLSAAGTDGTALTNADDDIFADLDMNDLGGDFDF